MERKTVSALEWYDDHMGHSDGNASSLAVAYENSKMLLFKDARDDSKTDLLLN